MIVLGIDPGTANTGYGVVARRGRRLAALDGGVIETRAGLALERRLATIHARVSDLSTSTSPRRSRSRSCTSARTRSRPSPSARRGAS
jgi:crossover junction endodeoxyribonuclease RuvC